MKRFNTIVILCFMALSVTGQKLVVNKAAKDTIILPQNMGIGIPGPNVKPLYVFNEDSKKFVGTPCKVRGHIIDYNTVSASTTLMHCPAKYVDKECHTEYYDANWCNSRTWASEISCIRCGKVLVRNESKNKKTIVWRSNKCLH